MPEHPKNMYPKLYLRLRSTDQSVNLLQMRSYMESTLMGRRKNNIPGPSIQTKEADSTLAKTRANKNWKKSHCPGNCPNRGTSKTDADSLRSIERPSKGYKR